MPLRVSSLHRQCYVLHVHACVMLYMPSCVPSSISREILIPLRSSCLPFPLRTVGDYTPVVTSLQDVESQTVKLSGRCCRGGRSWQGCPLFSALCSLPSIHATIPLHPSP